MATEIEKFIIRQPWLRKVHNKRLFGMTFIIIHGPNSKLSVADELGLPVFEDDKVGTF